MIKPSRKHTAKFKVRVVLAMLGGEKTLSQICSDFAIHHSLACRWKNKAIKGLETILTQGFKTKEKEKDDLVQELYQQIGQLKVESDWLKKKIGLLD